MEAPQPKADDDALWLRTLFADGIRPDPRRTLDEWAAAERIVAEGSYQGRWRHERTPYLTEIMRRCSLICPTRRVTLLGSAQIGKTQVGVNLAGQILSETPAQALIALPSLNSLRMYNRDKLDRMIQASPALTRAVADVTERSGGASTTAVKVGARGAQVELIVASSSRDLQSRTARVVIAEETSEYDEDVGGRGDPFEQLMARTIQWRRRGEKVVDISTPGIKGKCRVTKAYEAGSGGRFLVACIHCGHRQELRFAQLRWPEGHPEKAEYLCEDPACGGLMQERDKPRLLGSGCWVHDRPEMLDIHASYRMNTLVSFFTPWSEVAAMADKATKDPSLAKTFKQQWLGEAWDEAFDLPKAEILLLRRDSWKPGIVPPGVLFTCGATDVQGNRLVWALWGFDRNFGQWLIETGELHGDPTQDAVWRLHDALLARRWRDAWGKEVVPRSWGVDSGYLSGRVYAYVRSRTGRQDFQVMALDGRDGWRLPPIGKEVWKPIRSPGQENVPPDQLPKCPLYPVGTWDLKSELSSALKITEQGPGPDGWPPGALRFNEQVDRSWVDELLAERFVENPRTGARKWEKIQARNEAWDLAVYTRAQARAMTLTMTDEDWDALIASTQGEAEKAQGDLLSMITPSLKAEAEAARRAAEAALDAEAEEADALPPTTVWGDAPSWGANAAW
jgi:phage terminase large subunit GpA-like protein